MFYNRVTNIDDKGDQVATKLFLFSNALVCRMYMYHVKEGDCNLCLAYFWLHWKLT